MYKHSDWPLRSVQNIDPADSDSANPLKMGEKKKPSGGG